MFLDVLRVARLFGSTFLHAVSDRQTANDKQVRPRVEHTRVQMLQGDRVLVRFLEASLSNISHSEGSKYLLGVFPGL